MENNILIKFENEDHTLGALLRSELVNHPKTVFAAYKVPHPLYRRVEVRLQTTEDVPAEKVVNEVIAKYRGRIQSIQKLI